MVTTDQLKIISKNFLHMITTSKVENNDVRTIKYETGVFPRKLVSYVDPEDNVTKQKETPYQKSDIFVLFDVIVEKSTAGETVEEDDKLHYRSHMPFSLVVNIYGDEAHDEIQYMLSRLSMFSVRNYLATNGISLKFEPQEYQILDGKENGSWWIRRRIEIKMNTQQSIEITPTEFDTTEITIEEAE